MPVSAFYSFERRHSNVIVLLDYRTRRALENGWAASFIGGQKSEAVLTTGSRFLKDNPKLDIDLQLKIIERLDGLERAAKIREKYDQ